MAKLSRPSLMDVRSAINRQLSCSLHWLRQLTIKSSAIVLSTGEILCSWIVLLNCSCTISIDNSLFEFTKRPRRSKPDSHSHLLVWTYREWRVGLYATWAFLWGPVQTCALPIWSSWMGCPGEALNLCAKFSEFLFLSVSSSVSEI